VRAARLRGRRPRGRSRESGAAKAGASRKRDVDRKLSPSQPRRRLQREAAALLDGKKAVEDDDATCRICLMPLVPEAMKDRLRNCACKVEKLPCGHSFHFGCIQEWTKRQQRCPVCRAECPMIGIGPLPAEPLGSPPAGYLYSRRDFRLGEHTSIVQELVESGLLDSHPGVALQRLHASGVHIPLVSEEALAEAERLEQQIVTRAREGPRSFRIFGLRYVNAQVSGGVLEVIFRALADLRDLVKRRLWVRAFVRIEGLTRLMEDFDEWTAEAELAVQAVVGICSFTWVCIAVGVAMTQRARAQIKNFGDALKHGAGIIERMQDHFGMGEGRNCPFLRAHTRFLNAFAKASAANLGRNGSTEDSTGGGSACASLPALRRAIQQLEEPSLMDLLNQGASELIHSLEEVWDTARTTGALSPEEGTPPARQPSPLRTPGEPLHLVPPMQVRLHPELGALERLIPLSLGVRTLMPGGRVELAAGSHHAAHFDGPYDQEIDAYEEDVRAEFSHLDAFSHEGETAVFLPSQFQLPPIPPVLRRASPVVIAESRGFDRTPRAVQGAGLGAAVPYTGQPAGRRGSRSRQRADSAEVLFSTLLRQGFVVDGTASHHRA